VEKSCEHFKNKDDPQFFTSSGIACIFLIEAEQNVSRQA
jgi:hypothetical protein